MTMFVLVHGAFHGGWCFDLLRPELEARGHQAIAPDLPIEDPAAGCARYAECVLAAMTGLNDDVIVVGHSLGGLTIPLVAAERPVRRLIFLCGFIPWPQHSFSEKARTEQGIFPETPAETWPVTNKDGSMSWPPERAIPALYPDCSPDIAAWAASRLRRQCTTPHAEACPLTTWPDVPSSYILARQDPAVGAGWARRAAKTRLDTIPDEIDGAHSPFLSRPAELAGLLSQIAARR